jgi:hypothetical protein
MRIFVLGFLYSYMIIHWFKKGAFWIVSLLLIIGISAGTSWLNLKSNKPLTEIVITKPLSYGIIDPKGTVESSDIAYESIYWSWEKDPTKLSAAIDAITTKKRIPIIFVEPSLYLGETNFIFNKIIEGNYDKAIASVCGTIGDKNTDSIISFAPYMDASNSSKPWAKNDGFGYIIAYTYFTDKCSKIAKKSKYLWSPTGEGDTQSFYPSRHVDYVGLTATSDDSERRDFSDVFDPRYIKVKDYRKPIFITSLAVFGTPDYQAKWLSMAQSRIQNKDLHRFTSVVIYNQGIDVIGKKVDSDKKPIDYTITDINFPFK